VDTPNIRLNDSLKQATPARKNGGLFLWPVKSRTWAKSFSTTCYTFEGSINGNIAPEPRGPGDFQWDCLFIPEGETHTFAEMGDRKNEISMRRAALDRFATFLADRGRV